MLFYDFLILFCVGCMFICCVIAMTLPWFSDRGKVANVPRYVYLLTGYNGYIAYDYTSRKSCSYSGTADTQTPVFEDVPVCTVERRSPGVAASAAAALFFHSIAVITQFCLACMIACGNCRFVKNAQLCSLIIRIMSVTNIICLIIGLLTPCAQ